jgi:hypothetical protein
MASDEGVMKGCLWPVMREEGLPMASDEGGRAAYGQ